VFVSLPTPGIVREVALGVNGIVHGSAVRTFVDLSTTGSIVEREVAAALAAREIEAVDAPVSGGAAGAQKGTLAVMVAGRPEAIAGVRPLLDVFGKVFVVGEAAGQGQLMKLINNILSTTAFAITSEALVAGVKGGLDADTMLAVINAGSGRNSATEDKFPKWVLPRTFDFGFPIASVCKDISLAVEEFQALGVPMWVGGAARELWHYANAQGGAANDMTSLVKYIEAWADAEVRGKAAKP
jgi:2-hydroxy-3-oxopropionate reductase